MAQVIAFLKIIQDGILPHQRTESVTSTNLIFRLHTKYASTALIVTGTLLYIQQLFVDHLKCFRPTEIGTALESQPLNQYCYTKGTYAVRNETGSTFGDVSGVTHYHQYFQWVPPLLILQGMAFHLPQLVWNKYLERGMLGTFCQVGTNPEKENDGDGKAEDGDVVDSNAKEISTQTGPEGAVAFRAFALSLNSAQNRKYFTGFVGCEVMNLVMLLVIILTTEWFLRGGFLSMGPKWIEYMVHLRGGEGPSQSPENVLKEGYPETESYLQKVEKGNPMEAAFPSVFTCHWVKPMTSTEFIIPCILGQNVTHQRIYLLLWFLYFCLLGLGISNLIYRVRMRFSRKLRVHLIERHQMKRRVKNPEKLQSVLNNLSLSDWFILKRILQNVKPDKFDVILCHIVDCLGEGKASIRMSSRGGPSLRNNGERSREVGERDKEVIVEMVPMKSDAST